MRACRLAIVGEQEQAFAVGIEPPGDIDAGNRNQRFSAPASALPA
jgi:hypothetical protein